MKQNLETKVGLFLMFGIAVVCTLIIFFGEVQDFFKPTYSLTVTFANASGLLKGSDVYLSGALIGKVTTDPQPIPDTQNVQVRLKINNGVHIRTDASFVIGSSGLLGDMFVEVKPVEYAADISEDQKKPYLQNGDVIVGAQSASIEELTNSAEPLIRKATEIADTLQQISTKLNDQILSGSTPGDLKQAISNLKDMTQNGNSMLQHADQFAVQATATVKNADEFIDDAKRGRGTLGVLINDRQTAANFRDLIANFETAWAALLFRYRGPVQGRKEIMSEALSAVVVAAGRSQRMGFDKLLTPLAGRPLLLHTLERILQTEVPQEIVLVIRPGSEAEMAAVISPLHDQGTIRLVAGGEHRQDSVWAGLRAVGRTSEYVMVHDAARPFVNKELIDLVLAGAKLSGAAVCGSPCSDSLKEVAEDGLVRRTIDRSKLWTVQTPQIFRTELLRECYQSAVKSGLLFTDDTAVVEYAQHAVHLVLYHGINLKVTTPSDWKLAEAYMHLGESDSGAGPILRKHLHDLNNHLTPLLGYAYLLANEFPDDSRSKKFAVSVQGAGERCQVTAAAIQKIIRELFPRKDEPM